MIAEALWMVGYTQRALIRGLRSLRRNLVAWGRFWATYEQYRRLTSPVGQLRLSELYPCLGDDTAETDIEPIYFYQDSWAFEKVVQRQPPRHVDVGSHHKFVALLSKVVPVTMVDIRPLSLHLDSLQFQVGSILDMPYDDGSLPSVSSMCVVEHIGLGRYGDSLDYQGSEKAVAELKRIVAPGGDLYLSVPIDTHNKVFFNAHRVFSENYLKNLFAPFHIMEQRYIVGKDFTMEKGEGFCVACYHLRRST